MSGGTGQQPQSCLQLFWGDRAEAKLRRGGAKTPCGCGCWRGWGCKPLLPVRVCGPWPHQDLFEQSDL